MSIKSEEWEAETVANSQLTKYLLKISINMPGNVAIFVVFDFEFCFLLCTFLFSAIFMLFANLMRNNLA